MPKPQVADGPDDGLVTVRRSSSSANGGISSPGSLRSAPPAVEPKAGYIAAAAASQIVTDNCEDLVDTALVSQSSLDLINGFLDQLLFNFLQISRSTSLASLRPAIVDVLKPRLAKVAIEGADQELSEYLGGSLDEDEPFFRNRNGSGGQWDVELVWKRTRLRCMVYSSLGDMEEQDEDAYTEEQQLDPALGRHSPASNEVTVVSPAVAIFLTSILEFIGEQTLLIAGQAAFERTFGPRADPSADDGASDRVIVEDLDTEKVALNAALGRLWRTWRRRLRPSNASISRGLQVDGASRFRSPRMSPRGSIGSLESPNSSGGLSPADVNDPDRRPSIAEIVNQDDLAVNTPLPLSQNDVAEIEVPGYGSVDAETVYTKEDSLRRRSYANLKSKALDAVQPRAQQATVEDEATERVPRRPFLPHSRSRSLPSLNRQPYEFPSQSVPLDTVDAAQAQGTADPFVEKEMGSKNSVPTVADKINLTKRSEHLAVETTRDFPEDGDSFSLDVDGEQGKGFREPVDTTSSGLTEHKPQVVTEELEPPAKESFRTRSTNTSNSGSVNGLGIVKEELESEDESTQRNHDPRTIGIARTSDVPLSSSPNSAGRKSQTSSRSAQSGSMHGESGASERGADIDPTRRYGYQNQFGPSIVHASEDQDTFEDAPNGSTYVSRHGAPSLTPLREMMENAGDTSDDASLHALPNPRSHSKASINASKQNETKQPSPAPISTRATVQRVYTPTDVTREPESTRSRRSGSLGRDQRAIQGSGSFSSQTSHRTRRTPTGSQSELDKKSRASQHSDGYSYTSEGQSPIASNDKERSFEQLMQSDETIQYTLTPRNVREMEVIIPDRTDNARAHRLQWPESPNHARTETADLAEFLRTTAPPGSSASRSNGYSATVAANRNATSRSRMNSSGSGSGLQMATSNSKSQVPISPSSTSSKGRTTMHEPRDARLGRENTREIAEFLRSVEPNPDQVASPVVSSFKAAAIQQRSPPSTMAHDNEMSLPRSAVSSRSGPRLQARDAKAQAEVDSDLINFIRQGPAEEPRVQPKTTAPVKSHSESEDILSPGNDRSDRVTSSVSMTSTQDSYGYPKSLHSSLNSRTALLSHPGNTGGQSSSFSEHPARKQSRVRDPYAIDYDDDWANEDDEEEFVPVAAPARKPQRQEESLIDFLRNVPPPSAPQPTPVIAADTSKANSSSMNKKHSSPSLRSRLMPSNSSLRATGRKPSLNKPITLDSSLGQKSAGATNSSGDSNMYNGSTIVSTGSQRTGSAGGANNYGSTPRASSSQAIPEAREPYVSAGTRELADFLKNSGPPPSSQPVYANIKEERRFHKMMRKVRPGTKVI